MAEQRPAARRRRAPGGRKGAFLVKVTEEEALKLRARADAIGVSVPRLMVESALAGSGQTVSERRGVVQELLGARRLVGAIGNNVNQLARAYNSTGVLPDEVEATLRATVRVIERLEAAVQRFGGRR